MWGKTVCEVLAGTLGPMTQLNSVFWKTAAREAGAMQMDAKEATRGGTFSMYNNSASVC